MGLYLVAPEHGIALEIPISESDERALLRQWARLREVAARERFNVRLGKHLTSALSEALDWDIKAPTDAQMALASVLAQKLATEVPPGALSSRLEMSLFIDKASARLRDG